MDDRIIEDELGRICSKHGDRRNAYKIVDGNAGEKRLPARPRLRWENNIEIDLKQMGCRLDSIGSIEGSAAVILNTVMNLRNAQKARDFLTS